MSPTYYILSCVVWVAVEGTGRITCTYHVNIPLKINETLIDDPNIISNEFNDYFVSIGPKMAESVPLANHNYLHYLNNPLSKSMFLNPVTTDEVNDIILNLKTTKPYDSAELPINIIKKYPLLFPNF